MSSVKTGPTVKTAISLDRETFEEMERLARKKSISRSQLFAQAARDLVKRERNQDLIAQLNEAYADPPDPEEMEFLRRAAAQTMERLQREEEEAGAEPWT